MMRSTALLLAFPLVLAACDYVDVPLETPDGGGGGGEQVVRRVLLEDFTGHRCNNCPAASQVASQLVGVYGEEDLIVVGVHAGPSSFTAPVNPPNPDGSYATDFRTPAGNAYANQFGVTFLPTGMVSRREFNSSVTLSSAAWGSAVADILGTPADMEILFDTVTYDSGANSVHVEVKVALINAVSGDHNLTVYLLEDHVVDWQLDSQASPPDVQNYEHRHVLRDNLNGTWGEPVISGSAAAGDTLSFTYDRTLPASVVDPTNCALVAYVYRTDSYEVMQAREVKFP